MPTPTPDFGERWELHTEPMGAGASPHMIVCQWRGETLYVCHMMMCGLAFPDGSDADEAFARHIIACVNACAGIPTDRLAPGSVKAMVEASVVAMRHVRRTEWAEHIDCSFADNLWSALAPFQEPTP